MLFRVFSRRLIAEKYVAVVNYGLRPYSVRLPENNASRLGRLGILLHLSLSLVYLVRKGRCVSCRGPWAMAALLPMTEQLMTHAA